MRKILVFIICMTLFLGFGCSINEKVDPRESEILKLVIDEKFDEAISKSKEYYTGDELQEMLDWVNKHKSLHLETEKKIKETFGSKSSILEIQSNHTYKIKDGYIYITGRVKNIGDTDIEYFEVVCKFLDKDGQVLDSDYTNDGLVLKSGEMREFEIMHKYKSEYDIYSLSIGEVK
ncbi:MAG: hypothetical protein GX490_00660 [Bacilli bacterium]|nr:hypothetical protein [Bacilli bacterium]